MALIDGDEFVSGDILSYQQGNRLKDNWIQADPQANLGNPQEGMIVNDSDDRRLYLRRGSDYADIWTPDAPFPWANLISNSGFGVWSLSDANKGLATLVYDNLAGGNFAVGNTITGATSGAVGKLQTDNGATSMVLGAVSGTFQDNEQIGNGAGVTADVDGDTDIGIKNDPMNNDSTGDWTDDGANIALAFVAAEYTVMTNAATQRAWIVAAALSAGHIYKIELDIKDGTAAGADIEGYFNDGAAQYGRIETTAAGWASVSWVFECATTTGAGLVGFRIPTSLGGSNIEIRRFSCYEIRPCCTGADILAFETWDKDTTIDIYREYSGTNTQDGSFYALKMVPTAANDFVQWPHATIQALGEHIDQFKGRTVTFGAWVKTSTASHARLWLAGSVANTYSSYHVGDGNWQWLEVSHEFNQATTYALAQVILSIAGDEDGTTIVYVSQPMLIFGSQIGEGNYAPRQHEVIYLELAVSSNHLHGLLNQSTSGNVPLNLEADADGKLPKGAKAVDVFTNLRDSGSAGATSSLWLKGDNPAGIRYAVDLLGIVNNSAHRFFGPQSLSIVGDMVYNLVASGAGTLDVTEFWYKSVQVTN